MTIYLCLASGAALTALVALVWHRAWKAGKAAASLNQAQAAAALAQAEAAAESRMAAAQMTAPKTSEALMERLKKGDA